MSDVQGRLFPAFNRLPESGFLVVLLRELGDPLDADCVFVVASHMIEDTARLLAEFLQSSNGAPISLSSLDQCVHPLPGSTWNFGIAEATSEWVIKLVEGRRLMQWPDAVETPVDGIRGLIANLHLQSGEAFAPEGPLPDCDYTGLRRRVFGLRARELSDRVHGLQPLRDHTVDLVTSGKVDAHQLEDLQSDLDAALSGELGELGHELAATGAADVAHTIVGLADGGVAAVEEIGHPGLLELLGFAVVEPQALAAAALINDDCAVQDFHLDFVHVRIAFRAVHLYLLPPLHSILLSGPKSRQFMRYPPANQ